MSRAPSAGAIAFFAAAILFAANDSTGGEKPVGATDGGGQAGSKEESDAVWPAGTPIHGRVVDHDGHPCADAEVLLLGDEHIMLIANRRKWYVTERNLRSEPPPATRTDEHGDFALSTGGRTANRIAVIAPEVLLWVLPRKSFGKTADLRVQLPKPGGLNIHFDLPEKPKAHAIRIELRTFDDADWEPDRLEFNMAETKVPNPGQRTFGHLPPAKYSVERVEETRIGERSFLVTPCERKLIAVQSGKESDVRFEHSVGTTLDGQVKGLENVELRSAMVTIRYFGPEEQPRPDGSRTRFGTCFDVIPIKSDGHFITDPVPSGTYDFQLIAVRADRAEGSTQMSDFDGHAKVTVSESGEIPRVEIVVDRRRPLTPTKSGK